MHKAQAFFYFAGGFLSFAVATYIAGCSGHSGGLFSGGGRLVVDTLAANQVIVRDLLGHEVIRIGGEIEGDNLTAFGIRIDGEDFQHPGRGDTILVAVNRVMGTDGFVVFNGTGREAGAGPGEYIGLGLDHQRPGFPVGLEMRGTTRMPLLLMDSTGTMARVYSTPPRTQDDSFLPYVQATLSGDRFLDKDQFPPDK